MCDIDDCEEPKKSKGLCAKHYQQKRRRDRGLKKPGPAPDPSKPNSRHNPGGQRAPSELVPEVREKRAPRERTKKTHCPQGHEFTSENTYTDPRGYRHCKTCRRERMADRRPEGPGAGAHNAAKTHCPQGHPYDDENTIRHRNGRRGCRACARINGANQNTKRYGITVEELEEMSVAQGHRCLVCSQKFSNSRRRSIDHDHSCCPTGRSCGDCIRGLLCRQCNTAIGLMEDDVERLRAALRYLEDEPVASAPTDPRN